MKVELTLENLDEWRLFIEREGHPLRFTTDGQIQLDDVISTTYTVGQDYYFVLGDNRPNSNDSRYFGVISVSSIKAKIIASYFSNNRIHVKTY